MGKDAKDIRGFDLIEAMAKKSNYANTVADMLDATMLLAFDSGNYQLPTGDDYITRAQLVKNVTGQVGTAIAKVATASTWSTVDDVAMPLQALYPYISGDDNADTAKAVVKGTHFMESLQNQKGAYAAWGSDNNAWSLAQVMTAMGQLRINPCDESDGSDFIKEGKTVLDAASAFVNVDEKTVDESLMGYQPEQLLRGLNAVIRVMEGKASLYDLGDVTANPDPSEEPSASPDPSGKPDPSQTPSVTPSQTPSVSPAASKQTPAVSPSAPAATTPAVPTQTPAVSPSAPAKTTISAATTAPVVKKVKKVTAAKTKVTVKKGKKTTIKWNVTTAKNASIKKLVKVTVNKKTVKVVKTSVQKKKATVTQVTTTVKGIKKGSAVVTMKADGKKSKVKVIVK